MHATAAPESHPLQKGHGVSKADLPAAEVTRYRLAASMQARVMMQARPWSARRVEKAAEEEEDKRQAELSRVRDQLKKCLAEEDYTGAAAVKANIAALMSAEPCSQRHHGRSKADWSAVAAAGHGSQPATCPTVTSAI